MSVLVIGQDEKMRISALRRYAEEHVFTEKIIEEVIRGSRAPAGENPNYVVFLPMTFRVVFSYEIQPEPIGRARHISISCALGAPSLPVVNLILSEFGFKEMLGGEMSDLVVWQEDISINILEKVVNYEH